MTKILRLKNLYKEYKLRGEVPVVAVNNITLEIEQGEFIAICGVSGSGKSTLLHLISGVLEADSGEIEILDDEGKYLSISKMNSKKLAEYRNRFIGYVLQDFGLIPYRSVKENVAVPLYIKGERSSSISHKVDEALDNVGVLNLKNRPVTKLSGGQKQRVAIARAIVNNPRIILADEPTGALDSSTKEGIVSLFKEMTNKGKTVIMVTHDTEIADKCDRVIHIRDGKIVEMKHSIME